MRQVPRGVVLFLVFLVVGLQPFNLLLAQGPVNQCCQFVCYWLVGLAIPGTVAEVKLFSCLAPEIDQNLAVLPRPVSGTPQRMTFCWWPSQTQGKVHMIELLPEPPRDQGSNFSGDESDRLVCRRKGVCA